MSPSLENRWTKLSSLGNETNAKSALNATPLKATDTSPKTSFGSNRTPFKKNQLLSFNNNSDFFSWK